MSVITQNEVEAIKSAVAKKEWAPEGIELFDWRRVPATVGRVNVEIPSEILGLNGQPAYKTTVPIPLDHRIPVHDGPISEIRVGYNVQHRLVAWSAR